MIRLRSDDAIGTSRFVPFVEAQASELRRAVAPHHGEAVLSSNADVVVDDAAVAQLLHRVRLLQLHDAFSSSSRGDGSVAVEAVPLHTMEAYRRLQPYHACRLSKQWRELLDTAVEVLLALGRWQGRHHQDLSIVVSDELQLWTAVDPAANQKYHRSSLLMESCGPHFSRRQFQSLCTTELFQRAEAFLVKANDHRDDGILKRCYFGVVVVELMWFLVHNAAHRRCPMLWELLCDVLEASSSSHNDNSSCLLAQRIRRVITPCLRTRDRPLEAAHNSYVSHVRSGSIVPDSICMSLVEDCDDLQQDMEPNASWRLDLYFPLEEKALPIAQALRYRLTVDNDASVSTEATGGAVIEVEVQKQFHTAFLSKSVSLTFGQTVTAHVPSDVGGT